MGFADESSLLEFPYLYRGVSLDMHTRTNKHLKPKMVGSFRYTFHWNEPGAKWGNGSTWGESETNAVVRHQLNQEGFPTSGISTTPHFHRAEFYARGRSGVSDGVVYKIERKKCRELGVKVFVVADYVRSPSIPEDDEIILVAQDGEELPPEIIVQVIPISGRHTEDATV